MHYFIVAWLELRFHRHSFLGVLQWAVPKENPQHDSRDSSP